MAKRAETFTRDAVITLARYGKMTPPEAEAEAKKRGWPPFERKPEPTAFDPMRDSRWPIVMAVAWIAWRDLEKTRQQGAEFRAECTHWIFREWNEFVDGGKALSLQKGWFLETWSEPTTVRLSVVDAHHRAQDDLPASAQMSVRDAEAKLWEALSEGKLVAEALDRAGKPVDIPQRDWSYLVLYEEGKRDVLKFDSLDREPPYTRVKLKRDDLLRLWPRLGTYQAADEYTTWPIEPAMLHPITDTGSAGFVPLCAAVQWIMTDAGSQSVVMRGEDWRASVAKLWPHVCSGEIELIGLRVGHAMTERIPGHTLALMKVLPPLALSIDEIVLDAPSHIACTPYDREHWDKDFNDKLYEIGRAGPAWSHLQVSKFQLLQRWPRRSATGQVEQACRRWLLELMQVSPHAKPRSRETIWGEARAQWPNLAKRQFIRAWERAIAESGAFGWSKAGRLPTKLNRSTK